jgi:hypothetical protein
VVVVGAVVVVVVVLRFGFVVVVVAIVVVVVVGAEMVVGVTVVVVTGWVVVGRAAVAGGVLGLLVVVGAAPEPVTTSGGATLPAVDVVDWAEDEDVVAGGELVGTELEVSGLFGVEVGARWTANWVGSFFDPPPADATTYPAITPRPARMARHSTGQRRRPTRVATSESGAAATGSRGRGSGTGASSEQKYHDPSAPRYCQRPWSSCLRRAAMGPT